LIIGLAIAIIGAAAAPVPDPGSGAQSCSALTSLSIPNVKITSAVENAAGPFAQPGGGNALDVPAFCRVVAIATPSADSLINFEVWIPPAATWNGKFQGVGNSAWTGAIPYNAMATALRRGYATASSDAGHTGDDLVFGKDHPEKIVDWAYRAVHVMTEVSKLAIRARTGKLPEHSYYTGCSTAGGQGLMAAQRFPDDYDGIAAGNPGSDRTNRVASYLWAWLAAHERPESVILPAKLTLLNQAAIAACDALDGVKDGVIDDPRRCRFDPVALKCPAADEATCLNAAQVEAARKIYEGPKNPRTGQPIFPGVARGSETAWGSYYTASPEPQRLAFWKYFVFNDPNWDMRTFDWDRDVAFARAKMGPIVNATNPDLGPFKARGGKMVITAGWADPIHLSEQATQYYESVERVMGGHEKTVDFVRLFMVPGMGHCSPGPGPSTFDGLAALEAWVERGIAPEKIVASRSVNGKVDRTRPLCPYPQVARWNGKGSTDEAASFACVLDQR